MAIAFLAPQFGDALVRNARALVLDDDLDLAMTLRRGRRGPYSRADDRTLGRGLDSVAQEIVHGARERIDIDFRATGTVCFHANVLSLRPCFQHRDALGEQFADISRSTRAGPTPRHGQQVVHQPIEPTHFLGDVS